MSELSESEFASFKAQSDQAFWEMQRAADQAHAEFLQQYGGGVSPQSYFSAPTQAALPAKSNRRSSTSEPLRSSAEKLYEGVSESLGGLNRDSLDDSVKDARKDLEALSQNLREESRAAAREAMRGTSDILKGNASGLGQKAKEEATKLKEAMQKAMAEERSLRAMKGRAADEVRKARERMQQHVEEVKDDTLGDLQKMGQSGLSSLGEKAKQLFGQGQDVVEREWDDFLSGEDSQ